MRGGHCQKPSGDRNRQPELRTRLCSYAVAVQITTNLKCVASYIPEFPHCHDRVPCPWYVSEILPVLLHVLYSLLIHMLITKNMSITALS